MVTTLDTIGIRNHNPGNIDYHKAHPWQGLANPPSDGRRCRFVSAPYGIRALARNLITYQDKRKAKDGTAIDTVADIIARWAPEEENDTKAYAAFVATRICKAQGRDLSMPAERVEVNIHDWRDARPLVEAIIHYENGGQPYSDSVITKGLVLAGIEPPMKRGSRTLTAGKIAGPAVIAAPAVQVANNLMSAEQAQELVDQGFTWLEPLAGALPWIPAVLAVIALAGFGVMVYARYDDREKGLR